MKRMLRSRSQVAEAPHYSRTFSGRPFSDVPYETSPRTGPEIHSANFRNPLPKGPFENIQYRRRLAGGPSDRLAIRGRGYRVRVAKKGGGRRSPQDTRIPPSQPEREYLKVAASTILMSPVGIHRSPPMSPNILSADLGDSCRWDLVSGRAVTTG